ncbi:DnaJ subfamily B member 12 [Paragonimus westermani]|uniref:DnaJ subfamily B member 12 n=1 Tax=Paragonimus westermani TaxID=34504 RepID=A0A5J4NP09_9TREM|nr:DnaJ subfamily B member 12 [Paragonimus westermani]
MDANKDEAIRCISMARSRLASGQREVARKYVMKAMRLYPSISIKGKEPYNLFRKGLSLWSKTPVLLLEKGKLIYTVLSQNLRHKKNLRIIQRLHSPRRRLRPSGKFLLAKITMSFWGFPKKAPKMRLDAHTNCGFDSTRLLFSRLALKFHPDKNRAPGATEAFKKIGNALSVLTDTEKRRRYDQFGTEEEQAPRITPVYRHVDPFFQPDADVFSMFFNGGFPFAQVYRGQHHRPASSRESERENNYFIYIQLVPLILIFALSFFSNLFVKDPYYSLTSTEQVFTFAIILNPYSVERFTNSHRVPFYVKPTFEKDFDGNLAQLESQIEGEFENNLRIRCFREKEYRERMLFQARHFGDDADFQRAQRIQLRSCERLIEVFNG